MAGFVAVWRSNNHSQSCGREAAASCAGPPLRRRVYFALWIAATRLTLGTWMKNVGGHGCDFDLEIAADGFAHPGPHSTMPIAAASACGALATSLTGEAEDLFFFRRLD